MKNNSIVRKRKNKAEKPVKKNIPKKLKLVITIVNKNKADLFADLISGFSVNMQLLCAANGTASIEMLRYLDLASSDKSVILSIVREDNVKKVLEMLEKKFKTIRNGRGVAVVVPFSSIIGVQSYGFLSDNSMTVTMKK